MIEQISVANLGTYSDKQATLTGLKAVNFVYGPNGAGKSTIARTCAEGNPKRVSWKGPTTDVVVYSRDFVQRNFDKSEEIPGVFTLGEENVENKRKIANLKEACDKNSKKLKDLVENIQTTKDRSKAVNETMIEQAWNIKASIEQKQPLFREALKGSHRNRSVFFNTMQDIWRAHTTGTPTKDWDTLVADLTSVFQTDPKPMPLPSELDCAKADLLAKSPDIALQIAGGKDSVLATVVDQLAIRDWVAQGRHHHKGLGEKVCPFCQQGTLPSLSDELNKLFSNEYNEWVGRLRKLYLDYQKQCGILAEVGSRILYEVEGEPEADAISARLDSIYAVGRVNLSRIQQKVDNPTSNVDLDSLAGLVGQVQQDLAAIKYRREKHNHLVATLKESRSTIAIDAKTYMAVVELNSVFESHQALRKPIDARLLGMSKGEEQLKADIMVAQEEISTLERVSVSTQPTVQDINKMLSSFGFTSFSLQSVSDQNTYRLVRKDGTDALGTLSEGEKAFVTFLYFFHILRGSLKDSGVTNDRVVVIDDPVTSLDSDVLFVVSALVRDIVRMVGTDDSQVQQLIVLTHNVYFHKEVTFSVKRNGKIPFSNETFWRIEKRGGVSRIIECPENPVSTSYEMLWKSLQTGTDEVALQNVMRRILERYFMILGKVPKEEVIAQFEGPDRFICQSLFSWLNDGSHSVLDEMFVSHYDSTADRYHEVFRMVFEKLNHAAHYKMMMAGKLELQAPDGTGTA